MVTHLQIVGSTNVGGEYNTGLLALQTVTDARAAGKALLGAKTNGEIAFGLNCTNLMFHVARSIENVVNRNKNMDTNQDIEESKQILNIEAGDNIILSRACHDANIAPWLLLAKNLDLEVRWLECLGSLPPNDKEVDDSNMDCIDIEQIASLIDSKTRLISLGLASNATGRIHVPVVERINQVMENLNDEHRPYLILDGTHYLPHRRANLEMLKADAIICSAYKFFGPHIGVMAFNGARMKHLMPSKVGVRYNRMGSFETDLLDYGLAPDVSNCEISRWEMGTLNYEALAGFDSCVNYLASLGKHKTPCESKTNDRNRDLDDSFGILRNYEESLSQRFLNGIRSNLLLNKIRLIGSRDCKERTPTFALTLNNCNHHSGVNLVQKLNKNNILCTHGNHYAPDLVENCLNEPNGVTRISLLHYNTIEEVDQIVRVLEECVQK